MARKEARRALSGAVECAPMYVKLSSLTSLAARGGAGEQGIAISIERLIDGLALSGNSEFPKKLLDNGFVR